MPASNRRVSLIVFVIVTLVLVGLVPLVLTGWFLSEKSGRELRSAENRYQIQLVQEKARQIEIFGKRVSAVVSGIATGLELSHDTSLISSEKTETRLGGILRENTDLAALYIKPSNGESLSVFRSEMLRRDEVDSLVATLMDAAPGHKVRTGDVQRIASTGVSVIPFAQTVYIDGNASATVIAVASLQKVSQAIVGIDPTREEDLWTAGFPIVFAVDQKGQAVFHPDPALASVRRPMNNLKIVGEWLESGGQVESALVPFSATFAGRSHEMIGAYSTAQLVEGTNLGVITMQDEAKALASVAEMRSQTWLISMFFAVAALAIGVVSARFMTKPLMDLVSAAKRIASGDHSARVNTENITEIGTLAETFNMMGSTIEEQMANLAKAAEENRELFVGTVKALAAAIDGKDKYTRGHSERVSRISVAIGRRMNLPEDELETLRISALLHDVGKIAVDDAILKKPAALTDDEFEVMKTHPQKGYKIMSQIPAMKDFLPGMYMHHEMVNGKGYPQGLTGDQIPLQAKIVSVADTFDAMTIDRPYQKGMELGPALERLRSFVGTRYQSDVVEALIAACNAGEVGNGIIRQLASRRAAESHAETGLLDRLVA